jgi:hypothetical protein
MTELDLNAKRVSEPHHLAVMSSMTIAGMFWSPSWLNEQHWIAQRQ